MLPWTDSNIVTRHKFTWVNTH